MPTEKFLIDICNDLGFDLANFYARNEQNVLSCAGQPHYVKEKSLEPFQRKSTEYTFALGKGLPGRVWATQDFEWCLNVQHLNADEYLRLDLSQECDVTTCLGIPIFEEGVFIGVAEFYSVEERDCMNEEVAVKIDAIIEKGKAEGQSCLSRIPFEIQVVTALMIPVCFLVVFSAILLVENTSVAYFLESRKPMIKAMVAFDREISLERVYLGRYLQYNQSNGNDTYYAYRWWEYQKEWAPTDVKWNQYQMKLLELSPRDDYISERTVDLVNQIQKLSVTRQAVKNYLVTGPQARAVYSEVYEHSMGILTGMAQNPEVGGAYREVQILANGRRYVEAIDSLRGCLAEYTVLWENQNKTTYQRLRNEFYNLRRQQKRLRELYSDSLRDGEDLKVMFEQFVESPQRARFEAISDWIAAGARNVTFEELYAVSDALVLELDRVMMYQVNNVFGVESQQLATAEALKMVGALIPSLLATAFIVYWQVKVGQNAECQRQREEKMNKLVSNFVPKPFLRTMGVKNLAAAAPGEKKEVESTMANCDIRNFLSMCEGMSNSNIFAWLQRYFNLMTRVTDHHNGTIDSFTGDTIFSFFSTPTSALKCSIEWLSVAAFLNTQLGRTNMIEVVVGIHYGPVVFGVFGDSARRTCTMVSPEVNFTGRLSKLAMKYRVNILLSEHVVNRIDTVNFVQTDASDALEELSIELEMKKKSKSHQHDEKMQEGMELVDSMDDDGHRRTTERGLGYRYLAVIEHQNRALGNGGSNEYHHSYGSAGKGRTKLFEVFQSDTVHLKKYKQESKKFFEEAIHLCHGTMEALSDDDYGVCALPGADINSPPASGGAGNLATNHHDYSVGAATTAHTSPNSQDVSHSNETSNSTIPSQLPFIISNSSQPTVTVVAYPGNAPNGRQNHQSLVSIRTPPDPPPQQLFPTLAKFPRIDAPPKAKVGSELPAHLQRAFGLFHKCEKIALKYEVLDTAIAVKKGLVRKSFAAKTTVDLFDVD